MSRARDPLLQPGDVCAVTGRVAVLATEFADSDLNGDAFAYWYSPKCDSWGMDPWRKIDSIDRHTNSVSMDVIFADGGTKVIGPRRCIHVSAKHAAILQAAREGRAA